MKLNIFINIILVSLFVFCSSTSFSQLCQYKKKICKDDLGDFDYSSQTSYAKLSPGDTARVQVVAYSGKQYRVLVCADPILQNVQFKIMKPVRKENKSFTINLGDTIWTSKEYFEEKQLFDSQSGKSFWDANITEGGRLFIDIFVPASSENSEESACVNVYVGTKLLKSKENKGKVFIKK